VSRALDQGIAELRSKLKARGIACGAGLVALLSAHTAQAAPASLTASLGKLAISGAGACTAITPGAAITATLIAMTTTTKTLLAIAAVAAISVPIMLHHTATPPKLQATQMKAQPVAQGKSVAKAESTSDTRHYRPAPVTRQVGQMVDAILRRHKGMSKQQLQRSPELNMLMNRFITVMNTPEMQAKLEHRIAAIPPVKSSQQGTLRMEFDMLDDAHGRAWLEAAVSDDTQRIEDWILNTLDDAIFEFAFDPEMERTSNGVSVKSGSETKSGAPQKPED
jgi:hypothetical protein